jgi:tetratricopeptide (TPR) repeat protein
MIPFVCAGVVLATIAIFAAAPQDTPKASQTDKSTEAVRLNNLGAAYMNQQLFEKALKAFEQAAAIDSKFQIAQMNQGIALLNLGRIDAARKFLEQAVKQNPSDPHAWYNLGMLEKNSANI